MPMGIEAIFESVRDAVGRILIIAGALLLLVGVLFIGMAPFDQLVFALSSFFGTILFVAGLIVHFELHKVKFLSREGLSILMMSASAVFIVLAAISFFAGAKITRVTLVMPRGGLRSPRILSTNPSLITTDTLPALSSQIVRPYSWLMIPLAEIGLCLFVVGFLLRLSDGFF